MDEKLIESLKDYVVTANSGKYNSWEEINQKFPELTNYAPKILQDYVATYNSGKYDSWDTLNSKFPEFNTPVQPEELGKQNEVSGQGSQNTSSKSTEPLDTFQPKERTLGQLYPDQIRTVGGVTGDISYNIITDNSISPQALEEQGIKEPVYNPDGSLLFDPTGEAIEQIPETDLPVLRDIEEITVTAPPSSLSAGQSIKNSISNLVTQLRGFDDRLSIVSPEIYKKIFAGYMGLGTLPESVRESIATSLTEGIYSLSGRDVNADVQTSYQNLRELEESLLPTNQIIDSWQNSDLLRTSSAIIDGAFNLLGTALVSVPTAGAGLITELTGGALYDANVAKAELLGKSVEELYRDNQETVDVPLLIGGIGAGLEAIGLRGTTNAITRKLNSNLMKNLTTIGIDLNKEGLTELVQSGLEEVNTVLAQGGNETEAVEAFTDFITSKQGLEVYLKTLSGAGAATGVGRLSKGVVDRQRKQTLNQRQEQLDGLLDDLTNTTDPVVTEAIIDKISDISVEVQDIKDSDSTVLTNLDEDTIARVGQINEEMSRIESQIASQESELSESGREALEQKLDSLQIELDGLVENNNNNITNEDNQVDSQPIVEDTQVAPVGTEVEQAQELVTPENRQALQSSYDRLTEGMTESQIEADPDLVRMRNRLASVQQNETFTETEQSEIVNELSSNQNFLARLNDSAQRSTRIQELEQRLRDNIRQAGNLGIIQDGEQQARQNIEFIRDLTEYAVLRIADGTIKTANALADALSIPRGDVNVQQAFEDAQQINTIIQESTATPRRQAVKSTIRQATQVGTRGTVQLTNRQALTQRIRTLNEGARLGKRDIKEIRQGVSDLLKDLNEAKAFKGKVNATAIRRVANMVNNANTPKQVERATSVIEKVVDDAKFAQRLADIDNYKARMKRIAKSKSTPKDLARVLNGFSNINARDLEVANLDEYLTLAESIYRRETSVSNVNNENLQKLIDMANANKEERQVEREVRSQTPEAQQAKITSLRNNLVDRLGVEESVINEIDNGSKPLDEVITELQSIVDEMRSTREDAVRNIADEYMAEIKSNKESILEGVVNPVERRLVEEFIDLDSTQSDVTKSTLGKYVTTLYNLLNNSSGVGLGDVITEIKRNRAISDKTQVDNLQSFLVTPSKLFSNLNAVGATSGSQVFDAIVKNKENVGDLHEFTGFADVQIKSVQAQTRIEKIKQAFNNIVSKHGKDLNNNPEGEVLMSIYADAVQYRRSWDAEQIANEFNLRIEAWGESLVRMQKKADSNSEYAKSNKSVISTLEKVLERIADRTTVDGKEVWSTKVNQEELFNMLSNGHRELYKFMRSTFSELQNEHFAISRVYGGLDVETDWVNYIPRNYTSIPSTSETAVARSLASATGRIQDAGDINFNQSLTKENTGSGKTRLISGNKLPLNKTLNTKSINTFLTEMGGIVYDIETMAERKFTASMLDFERNGLKFEDEVPLNLYKEKVAQKILGDRFSISVGDLKPSVLKRAFSKVSRLGTAVALGGAPQFIKQTTPLVETFGRVSNPKHVWTAMQYVFSPETQDLFKMGDVTLRNIENEITLPATDNSLVSSEQTNEMLRMLRDFGAGADKLSEKAIKLSLAPLKLTDNVVAKVGWLALYIDRASQRNGGVIDFSKPDRNAISYANTQNSIVMNESDPALQGRFLRTNWLRMMFPFSSFSINSKITLFQSIDRLIKADNPSDRVRYSAQVTTNLGNIALFNAIGYGIRAAAISSGAYFLNTIITNSDSDEEEKEELLEELGKDTENRQALNNIRSVGYLTQDFLFGGLFGKFLEPATESATDYIIRATYGDDELRARGFSNAGMMIDKEWYEDLFTVMGTAGIYGQRVADTWKLAADLGESDKDYVTRRFREVNSLKDDIVIDSWYLDPANIDKYAKPEWERASVTQATLMSAMSLTGLSDQWFGSSRRYMSTLSRNLLSKEHGRVSTQSKRELIESSKKVTNIKLGKTDIPLDYEQKIWYYNEYYNTALQERNSIPKPKGQSETEYEKLITSISESKMKIKFLDRYRKQFDKSVDKYIKEARKDAEENSNKIRYYNR